MNELFTEKIKLALRSCQFHIQGVLPYELFEDISSSLFILQNKGVLIEFIILMENEMKSIKTSNTLLRVSAGGGQLYTLLNHKNENSYFINIDKKIRLSSIEPNEETMEDTYSKLTNGIIKFNSLKLKSNPVLHKSGCPEIIFSASKEWVKAGDKINLFWEVDQAQSVHLSPQELSLPLKGSIEVEINMDCLFTIQAINENLTSEKRIFIKSLTSNGLNFSVQILTNNLNDYIPLTSHPEIPFHYAIPPDCHIRLSWEADQMGILKEEKWGELPVHGYRDIQFNEDTTLVFILKTIFELKKINLYFYILREKPIPELSKEEKTSNFLFNIFKKRH